MKNICFPPPSLLIPFLPLGPALMILVIVSPLRQGTARTRDGLTPSQQKCSRRHASRHQPQRRAVVTIGTTIYSRCSKKKSYNKANTVNFSSTTANQFLIKPLATPSQCRDRQAGSQSRRAHCWKGALTSISCSHRPKPKQVNHRLGEPRPAFNDWPRDL